MGKWQSDSELTIDEINGNDEFTDTNVLRVIDVTDKGYNPESEFNGLYLSNVWDCGQYTQNGEGTPYGKYSIDDSATAENHFDRRYRNGVRYNNG